MSDPDPEKPSPQPSRRLVFRLTRNLVLYYKKPYGKSENRCYERCRDFYDLCHRVKTKAYDKPRFFIEVIALFVVGVYTICAFVQSCEMIQATEIASDNLCQGQRPW